MEQSIGDFKVTINVTRDGDRSVIVRFPDGKLAADLSALSIDGIDALGRALPALRDAYYHVMDHWHYRQELALRAERQRNESASV